MATSQANLPQLHQFLGIGQLILALIAMGLQFLGIVPLLPTDDGTRMIAYVLIGLAAVLIAAAVVVFKPRVPSRRPEQPVEQYWATPEVGARVLPVWFLLEGAGVLSVVGFLATGELVSAIATSVAIVAIWSCGPKAFAKPAS